MSEEKLDRIEATLERLEQGFIRLDTDARIIGDRVDTYQKASTQVVNLAFSLIVAATLAIIIPVILGR